MKGVQAEGFDLLSSIKDQQTHLFTTLLGFRQTMSKHLGLKALPFVFNDNAKVIARRENLSYPYGYFRMSSFDIMRDQQAVKTLRRLGSSISLNDITDATISKGFLFPASISLELHFIHNDPKEVLLFIEKTTILGATDGFSFVAKVSGSSEWTVGVMMDEGPISIPESVTEDESEPGALDIVVNFRLNTKVGIVKSVPKINNEGKVTRNIVLPTGEKESF